MKKSIAPFLILVLGVLPGAFGQTLLQLGPYSPEATLESALESKGGLEEQAALQRVKRILSFGGAVKKEDKAFLNEWFPKFVNEGLVGRKPTAQERTVVQDWFPRLAVNGTWLVTGEACRQYNCISWSVGVTGSWLWPSTRVADYDQFYLSYGYVPLAAGESPADADIALWRAANGEATHGCRRVAGEVWESKLGSSLRVLHRLDELESAGYGKVTKLYRRAAPEELRKLGVTAKTPDGDGSDPCAARPGAQPRFMSAPYDLGSPRSDRR
jgi:hypothetical protein